jgi:phosphoglycolate phosphatase-like HAD superfamily hydrolase
LPAKEVVAIPARDLGVSEDEIARGLEKVFSVYATELENRIRLSSQSSGVVLPGVVHLLQKIAALRTPMGIVTGNIRRAGEAVMKGSNLYRFFDTRINSYADDVSTRAEIVSNAIHSAERTGLIDKRARIYVFGDTPSDVEASKANGCVSVAVIKNSNDADSSPGGNSYRERRVLLEASKPDFLFDDYTDAEKIIKLLGLNK